MCLHCPFGFWITADSCGLPLLTDFGEIHLNFSPWPTVEALGSVHDLVRRSAGGLSSSNPPNLHNL